MSFVQKHFHKPHQTLISYVPMTMLALCSILTACNSNNETANDKTEQVAVETVVAVSKVSPRPAIDHFLNVAATQFSTTAANTAKLHKAIKALLDQPSETTLDNARKAWARAHKSYTSAEIYIYSGVSEPFSLSSNRPNIDKLGSQINQWPMLGGYIDHVPGYPDSGLISDINMPITQKALLEQHGFTDAAFVTLGFHAIEFMLWGESDKQGVAGNRSAQEFLPELQTPESLEEDEFEPAIAEEQLSQNRRRKYLSTISDKLVIDIQELSARWQKSGDYSKQVLGQNSPRQVAYILSASKGSIQNNLIAKHLQPVLNGNQEDANQSIYSNTTYQGIQAIITSLKGVFTTKPGSTEKNLGQIISSIDATLSQDFEIVFIEVEKSAINLPKEYLVSDSKEVKDAVQNLVDKLQLLIPLIDKAGLMMGSNTGKQ